MTSHGTRTARLLLASTSWLLLTGLSCKYNVTLPWVPADASQRTPDVSFDLASSPDLPPPSPDSPLPGPDVGTCPGGRYKTWNATRAFAQIIVAIDRSTSMQKDFDSSTKTQTALSALNYLVEHHPGISFSTIWFPWNNCGGPGCCASPVLSPTGKTGPPDASGGCGPFDAGCLPPSPDSPAHQALRKASSYINTKYFRPWNSTVILITDQNPSCASESSSDACNAAADQADQLGSELAVRTFVMVPSDGQKPPDCLIWMANRNAHNFSDAEQLLTARNAGEMREKLDKIATGIDEKLCLFYVQEMDGPIPIDHVEIGGETIVRDESGRTGWKMAYGAILLSPEECAKTARLANPEVKAFICSSSNGPGGP